YDRRNRYRYRQELVPRRRSRWAWRNRATAEVVAGSGGNTVCQYGTLPGRHGGLCRRASSQSPAEGAWARCPADAGEVRAAILEGEEDRLPRCGGNRRGGPAPDDEVRGYEDSRSVGSASVAPRAGAPGRAAHGDQQSDPRLSLGTGHCRAAGAALLAQRVAGHPGHALRGAVAAHGPPHRESGRRLASAG